jgi:pSer/pThr/pTyr-binding forkhead associated (FHA) protein
MAYLLVTTGKSAGNSFDLAQCPLSVGRDVTQNIRLRDKQVSGRHLLIDRLADGTFTVTPQPRATRGLSVNGDVVPQAVLANGDRIRIGDTELLFLATDQASQVEAVKRIRVLMPPSPAVTPSPAADEETSRSIPHDPPIATKPPRRKRRAAPASQGR